jgi:hypothetical protein
LFRTGSAPGIRPSKHFPRERYPGCYHPDEPTYRFARWCSRRPKAMDRPKRAPVPGVRPSRESLAADKGLSSRPLDAPLGLSLLRSSGENLVRTFVRTPLSRFAPRQLPATASAPQSIDRLPLGSIRSPPQATTMDDAAFLGFLHRAGPKHESEPLTGLCVHLTSRRTLLPTVRRSWVSSPRSTGVVSDCLRCCRD